MKILFENFQLWLTKILQPIVEKKFILKDTWELEKVENKGIRLPYVIFENKSIVINNFIIPVQVIRMRFELFNKDIKAGRILFDGPVKIPLKSKKSISMEVRLNHITALFNMLRFVFTTNSIRMQIKGEVQIKILGLDFFIPVNDIMDLPKNKVQMIIDTIENKSTISNILFEDIEESMEEESPITNQELFLNNEIDKELEKASDKNTINKIDQDTQKKIIASSDEHNPL